jgi:pyruvate dehydrogenase E2 component (dihydrolipoamide acetyltransferase)
MATKVHMEALSPTMEEGQVVRWLKSEGDEVAQGDILAEIETDKATMELVARGGGILRKIISGEGAAVPVGEVIAVIGAPQPQLPRAGTRTEAQPRSRRRAPARPRPRRPGDPMELRPRETANPLRRVPGAG